MINVYMNEDYDAQLKATFITLTECETGNVIMSVACGTVGELLDARNDVKRIALQHNYIVVE